MCLWGDFMYDEKTNYIEIIVEILTKLNNKQLYTIYNFIKTFKKEAD